MINNPLKSKKIDGNTLNIDIDNNDDKFHCLRCNDYVPEEEWNNKHNCCYSCFWGIKK